MRMMLSLIGSAALVAATASAQTAPTTPPAPEKLICKRTLETGSLVRSRKQCFTRQQWNRVAESAQVGSDKMVRELAASCGIGDSACGF